MKICPFCKEEIPEEAIVCPVCSETLKNVENVSNKTAFNIIAVIIIAMVLSIIAIIFTIKLSSNTTVNENTKKLFKQGVSSINAGLAINLALENDYCDTPNKLRQMFINHFDLNNAKSTKDTMVTKNNMSYKIIPLNPSCGYASDNADEKTACARIIIDINADKAPNKDKKDRFSVLAYKNKVICEDKFIEEVLLDKRGE